MEFDEVVAGHGRGLVRFAYLLCHDSARAEDLTQEALSKFWARWRRHGAPERVGAYLRRVVVTEYLGWRRRRVSTEWIGLQPDEVGADPADPVGDLDIRDLAWRALATLTPRQRTVLVLRFYEALPDREIAVVLGVREATVRSLAARALTALRRHPAFADHVPTEVTP